MSLIQKIAGTFAFKLLGAALNFLMVVAISRYLGPGGKGEASLLIANISIILLFTGILGGTALIYLTPRVNIYLLLLPAYAAAFFACLAGGWGFYLSGLATASYCIHLGALALLFSLVSINSLLLLGKEQVHRHNLLSLLIPLLTGLFLMLLFWLWQPAWAAYRLALYLAYGVLWMISWYFVYQLPDRFCLSGLASAARQLARYGFTGQLANMLTFLNNRLSFYLLYAFVSVEAVGLYSVGVSVSEGLWLMGRSIALVQYARIANSSDLVRSAQETARLARLSLWLTLLALLGLLALPAGLYGLIFGPGFSGVKQVVWGLSPGIAAVSLGNILIHYFSGLGQYRYNVQAAIFGLALLLPGAYLLLTAFGLKGMAWATSLSQLAATAYLVWVFHCQSGFPLKALLPQRRDMLLLKARLFHRQGRRS